MLDGALPELDALYDGLRVIMMMLYLYYLVLYPMRDKNEACTGGREGKAPVSTA